MAFLVVLSQNKYVFSPRLLSEMPKLNLEMATAKRGAAGAPGPDTSGEAMINSHQGRRSWLC